MGEDIAAGTCRLLPQDPSCSPGEMLFRFRPESTEAEGAKVWDTVLLPAASCSDAIHEDLVMPGTASGPDVDIAARDFKPIQAGHDKLAVLTQMFVLATHVEAEDPHPSCVCIFGTPPGTCKRGLGLDGRAPHTQAQLYDAA